MLINTYLETEDFVYLGYPDREDERDAGGASHGCSAGARLASKYTAKASAAAEDYSQVKYAAAEAGAVAGLGAGADCVDGAARGGRAGGEAMDRRPGPSRLRAADLYPRTRAHYDEPHLHVPIQPLCGEFVQFVGRTSDGGVVCMSNYRLHAQPRRRRDAGVSVPLRLVDSVEIKDMQHLHVACKDGKTLKCTFDSGEACAEWWRRVTAAAAPPASVADTFAAVYAAWARELPPASAPRALLHAPADAHRHWFSTEVERLEFTNKGAWRVTAANAEHKLCPSYPPLLVVPATIGDEDLDSVARFRSMRRVPAVVWRHRGNGAVIARSSQPEVGWLGWRSSEDERLLSAFVAACAHERASHAHKHHHAKQNKLLIVDARSYASAVTNRARGGGCECAQYYPLADIQFMCLPNIHHVRRAFHNLRALAAEPPDQPNWHSNLERTLWLQYVSGLGRAASLVGRAVLAGRPVLVHCSDGWDRTPQIVATAELLLDPYYRTIEGFRILIEREWLDYGHKFADRCGHAFGPEDPNERSPIFLQWLDLVHQIQLQYPCSFEFNDAYLIKLVTHAHSCMFGTFLCNSGRERADARLHETTAHVWRLLSAPAYRNHLYARPQHEQVLWPEYNVRSLHFWAALYVGWRADCDDDGDVDVPEPTQPPPPLSPTAGVMTKTRSCDDLLGEVDKPPAQRRSSDPALAPDVAKLSQMCRSNSRVSLGAKGATTAASDDDRPPPDDSSDKTDGSDKTDLSTSCSDSLPTQASDQTSVDGLQLNLFEKGATPVAGRPMASNSSSLERELAPAAQASQPLAPPLALAPPSPEEPPVFFDNYADVMNVTELQRESARVRQISITWRSVSESSHHTDSSTGFDITEVSPRRRDVIAPANHAPGVERGCSPLAGALAATGDLTNHNASRIAPTNHMRLQRPERNGDANHIGKIDEDAVKLLEVELGNLDTRCESSSSSDGEGEGEEAAGAGAGAARGSGEGPCGSQQTLCPTTPPRRAPPRLRCPHCCRRCSSEECRRDSVTGAEWWRERGGGGGAAASEVVCACGAGAGGAGGSRDPIDGLPPAHSPTQARLHHIILTQRMALEELSMQLRAARAALRERVTSPAARAAPPPPGAAATSTPTPTHSQATSSCSGSEVEVEVGEEAGAGGGVGGGGGAGGVVWLPDEAAPRCQYCRNHFWLARRRHHCRKCGGVFCGSCSKVGGEWPAVRVCRLCRSRR